MSRERVHIFDNLKGLLIMLVVVGHLIEPLAGSGSLTGMVAFDCIYLFHMPLFVFVTGLFSKGTYRDGKYRAEVPIYYFLLCVLMYTGLFLERRLFGLSISYDLVTLNGGTAPWYLMAAGFYVLAVPFFARLRAKFAITASILIALYIGTQPSTDVFAVYRVLNFLPFFLAGFYLDSDWLASKVAVLGKGCARRSLRRASVIAAVAFLVLIVLAFALMDEGWLTFFRRLFTARNSYATAIRDGGFHFSRWFALLARLCWYCLVVAVGLALLRVLPFGKSRVFGLMGRRSLQVYFIHPYIMFICSRLGLVPALCSVLPDATVLLVLVALGFLLSYLLSLIAPVQKGFDCLKQRIALWVEVGQRN